MKIVPYLLAAFILALIIQTARGADHIQPPEHYRYEETP